MSESMNSGETSKHFKAKVSYSSRTGLLFPVSHMDRMLCRGNFAKGIGATALVYVAAVLEYLIFNIVDRAGYITKHHNRHQISPWHLKLAIRNDFELNKLLGRVTNYQRGDAANNKSLLFQPKKTKDRKSSRRRTVPPPIPAE
ncbi:histone H2A-beta, sperm-like [Terrapene carolina triunguis]|uniref:histone H2A-beta, sperm-like n=1 Tax=Terrapene triunguis TaxID=2587831 RepID=UPI000E778DB1|nr:histone H2A-beta, sperm-like [Terrapene carolina triunguis]